MRSFLIKYSKYIILAGLIYMPLFSHLDTLPIRLWDEARQATSAYEMLHNHNFLIPHFDGHPDMWNTKPPLLIWLQVLSLKVFGVNELAIRLPSAIAALLTCMLLLFFLQRYLKQFWFGFIAVLVLITSSGYVHIHVSRTGDFDALLILFTTLSGLLFFAFCETKNKKHLYLFFLFTALAVLTKSVTGLLFMPALAIYSVIRKEFIPLLKNKHFYIGLFSCVAAVLSYYGLREIYNPGYVAAVLENEWGGRYLSTIESHDHGFWYYYDGFLHFQFSAWYAFVPFGLAVGLFSKDQRIRRITVFSALMTFLFFMVISTAQTKLEWYNAPLYPFLAILVTVAIYFIFDFIRNIKWIDQVLSYNIIPYIFLIFIFAAPYRTIFNKSYKAQDNKWGISFHAMGRYLQAAVKGEQNVDGMYILNAKAHAHNLFYVRILRDKGVNISFHDWKILKKGNTVIFDQAYIKKYVEEHYEYKVIRSIQNLKVYEIIGKKLPPELLKKEESLNDSSN